MQKEIEKILNKKPHNYAQLKELLPGYAALGPTLDAMVHEGILVKQKGLYKPAPQTFAPATAKAGKSGKTLHAQKKNARDEQARAAAGGTAPQKSKVQKSAFKTEDKKARGKTRGAKNAVTATVVNIAPNFGFARTEAGHDAYVARRDMLGAVPGDEVRLELSTREDDPRAKGRITAVTSPRKTIVGTLERAENGTLMFLPSASNGVLLSVRARGANEAKAKAGDKVAMRFLKRGATHGEHLLAVETVFGAGDSAAAASKAALYAANVRVAFPQNALAQASAVQSAGVAREEIEARRDLRGETIFTIDGASTKDIDDAISLKKLKNGYELGVHIADVSHYVKQGSPLDDEAFQRGTSVYYANSVVPMLPKALSNGICSLNPNEDRLAFSCFIRLNEKGEYVSAHFEKTVIKSCVQGVYSEINALLAGDKQHGEKYAQVLAMLGDMQSLYEKLAALRRARGSADIHTHEAYITVGEDGRATGVKRRESGTAEAMIEEFMLQANNAAARFAKEHELPFVYRVHGKPELERVVTLQKTLRLLGLDAGFAGDIPTNLELAKILDETAGTSLELAVHLAVLRTMPKAVYSHTAAGHFGLALEDYAQFTSPIRRYPDLAIHRILSAYLQSGSQKKVLAKYEKFAAAAAVQGTAREIAAVGAERTCESCYKAEYMAKFIGDEFDGVVSSVAQHGLYAELENTVDGLVSERDLTSAGYTYQEGVGYLGKGEGLRIGTKVRVRLDGVDVARGRINFSLI